MENSAGLHISFLEAIKALWPVFVSLVVLIAWAVRLELKSSRHLEDYSTFQKGEYLDFKNSVREFYKSQETQTQQQIQKAIDMAAQDNRHLEDSIKSLINEVKQSVESNNRSLWEKMDKVQNDMGSVKVFLARLEGRLYPDSASTIK